MNKMMTYKESLQGAALFFVTSRFAGPAQEMKVRFFFVCPDGGGRRRRKHDGCV